MNKLIIHFPLVLAISIAFSFVNSNAYFWGNQPNSIQACTSILYIILWSLYGLFFGLTRKTALFIMFNYYWIVGTALYFVGFFFSVTPLIFITGFILPGPTYGIRRLLDIPSDYRLVFLCILLCYGLYLVGTVIGASLRRRKSQTS